MAPVYKIVQLSARWPAAGTATIPVAFVAASACAVAADAGAVAPSDCAGTAADNTNKSDPCGDNHVDVCHVAVAPSVGRAAAAVPGAIAPFRVAVAHGCVALRASPVVAVAFAAIGRAAIDGPVAVGPRAAPDPKTVGALCSVRAAFAIQFDSSSLRGVPFHASVALQCAAEAHGAVGSTVSVVVASVVAST